VRMKRIFLLLLCTLLCFSVFSAQAADADTAPAGEKTVQLLSCDKVDDWSLSLDIGGELTEGEVVLDTEDQKEGEGCISATVNVPKGTDTTLSLEATFTRMNIAGADSLTFDFYISDPALLHSTVIMTVDLSSANSAEEQLLDWPGDVLQSLTEPGWYHVELPFSKALNMGFNDSSVHYFRLYLFHVLSEDDLTDVEIKIDNVAVKIPEYRTTLVEGCDTVEGWTGGEAPYAAPPTLDTAVKKQGAGSIRYTVNLPGESHLVSQKVYAAPINVKGASYVEMDVYVSDISVFENCRYAVQFEVTSSGTCDHQEYCWSLDEYITKSGWTHIRLPIEAASICAGAGKPELTGQPDLGRVNYFRFHTLGITQASNNQLVFRVDNISFSFPVANRELFYGATPIVDEDVGGDVGGDVGSDVGGEENQMPTPDIPDQGTTPDNKEKELRARQTEQRAKIVILLMAFAIIGVDIVAVALRRKRQELVPDTGDGPPDEVS